MRSWMVAGLVLVAGAVQAQPAREWWLKEPAGCRASTRSPDEIRRDMEIVWPELPVRWRETDAGGIRIWNATTESEIYPDRASCDHAARGRRMPAWAR